ncbi:MAG: hypothetical protein HUJ71_10385 [Pseudobutyrivibrio sp.]|nr:hypothetical protein [Pseudobutyrivibrio sp.]
MDFTYDSYANLIRLIQSEGYTFTGYHDFGEGPVVIMRHDIDTSVKKAYEMSLLEDKLGIKATYYALLNTDFYNVASNTNRLLLQDMISRGHEIGLHFDEAQYSDETSYESVVEKEIAVLSAILDHPVTTVSMHRPSQKALEGDWQFEGVVNSYSKLFFKEFKYLSDSRMRWREDPVEAITSHEYDRIQIVTHPFWYSEDKGEFREKLYDFIELAATERYDALCDNIRDFEQVISREEI